MNRIINEEKNFLSVEKNSWKKMTPKSNIMEKKISLAINYLIICILNLFILSISTYSNDIKVSFSCETGCMDY